MPILQGDNPWGNLAGLVGAYFGIQGQAKERKRERERQARLDAEQAAYRNAQVENMRSEAAHRTAMEPLEIQRAQADIARDTATTQKTTQEAQVAAIAQQHARDLERFHGTLRYPQNWAKMSPRDQWAYLSKRQNEALKRNDYDLARSVGEQMKSLMGEQNTGARIGAQERGQDLGYAKALAGFDAAMQRLQLAQGEADRRQAERDAAAQMRQLTMIAALFERQRRGEEFTDKRDKTYKTPAAARTPKLSPRLQTLQALYRDLIEKGGKTTEAARSQLRGMGYTDKELDQVAPPTPVAPKGGYGWGKPMPTSGQ